MLIVFKNHSTNMSIVMAVMVIAEVHCTATFKAYVKGWAINTPD